MKTFIVLLFLIVFPFSNLSFAQRSIPPLPSSEGDFEVEEKFQALLGKFFSSLDDQTKKCGINNPKKYFKGLTYKYSSKDFIEVYTDHLTLENSFKLSEFYQPPFKGCQDMERFVSHHPQLECIFSNLLIQKYLKEMVEGEVFPRFMTSVDLSGPEYQKMISFYENLILDVQLKQQLGILPVLKY